MKQLYDSYQATLSGHLTETMNTFWAECYEGSKMCVHRRNREQGESKMRFQVTTSTLLQLFNMYRALQKDWAAHTFPYSMYIFEEKNQE